MSNNLSLEMTKRAAAGKDLKSLRAAGQIPSVVYGGDAPVLAFSGYNATEKALRAVGYHSPLELNLEGNKQLAIVKRVDVDPVSRRIINVEFQAISANEVVEATTPIAIINFEASEASKKHLVYLQVMEEIEVKARPSDLPNEITVDGSKLAEVDDRLTVADLDLPKGVELVDKELDPTAAVANVYDPAAEAAAREAASTTEKPAEETAAPAADEAKSE